MDSLITNNSHTTYTQNMTRRRITEGDEVVAEVYKWMSTWNSLFEGSLVHTVIALQFAFAFFQPMRFINFRLSAEIWFPGGCSFFQAGLVCVFCCAWHSGSSENAPVWKKATSGRELLKPLQHKPRTQKYQFVSPFVKCFSLRSIHSSWCVVQRFGVLVASCDPIWEPDSDLCESIWAFHD